MHVGCYISFYMTLKWHNLMELGFLRNGKKQARDTYVILWGFNIIMLHFTLMILNLLKYVTQGLSFYKVKMEVDSCILIWYQNGISVALMSFYPCLQN